MKKSTLWSFIFLFLVTFTTQAQDITVSNIQFGKDVENRTIVGQDTTFSSEVGNVYCLTQIKGAQDTTYVSHVWKYEDEEKATIKLKVRSNDWRTWSSKAILPAWAGTWTVEVVDRKGNVLNSGSFEVEK